MFSTGDLIVKKLNLQFTEVELADFPNGEKFCLAPEVEEIAKQLITLFRDDLRNYKIAYVFKKAAAKTKTGEILGTAKKENDLSKVLHGFQGVITIAWDKWATMDKDQKARLVYHELLHYAPNFEKGILEMVEHPINEFPEVIRIFGPGQEQEITFIEAYNSFSKDNATAIDLIKEELELKKKLNE